MANYLITGASRGIGLELTKQLLELPDSQVDKLFAITRGDPSPPLRDLLSRNPDRAVHILASVDDTESVQKAARDVQATLGTRGLDVLVNNAGVQAYCTAGTRSVPPEQMAHLFDVNVIGPQRMIAAFLPLLEAGKLKKVINVSSSMGSVSWAPKFKLSPTPSYKISKAALHMLNAQYALDHAEAGFTFLCVSPGWLRTEIGGEHADFDVQIGVTELKRIILASNQGQNGKFVNIHVPGQEKAWGQYDGGEIPW
ncbi:MAG: hypothetical protein L6R40_008548 [Gallowayella cf. fulva]|nr:MAG: hypothetical protein L6R40_008548 [Xanthomendoza cf. fulva]